ncbi:MAG: hypothetical protein JNL90_14365 [Planctomycetes bacterium]|nr:hypothetical protein [Planctomycetota bacterium]
MSDLPPPGRTVFVRRHRWLIECVEPPASRDESSFVSLACLDDDAQGQRINLLCAKEFDTEVEQDAGWERTGRQEIDEARMFATLLRSVR